MTKGIFERRFGINPKELSSVEEVNSIIEKKIGRKLEIKNFNALPIKDISADEVIDRELDKCIEI